MTEMFGSKDDFGGPKYSAADSYIGILSAYRGRIHHTKPSRNGPESTVSLPRERAAILFHCAYVNTIECTHGVGIVWRLEMSNCAILYLQVPLCHVRLEHDPNGASLVVDRRRIQTDSISQVIVAFIFESF